MVIILNYSLYSLVAESATQQMCRENLRTGICTRNPGKFCEWNPLTVWNMFKDLSLESTNIQTQNCAPIQCTVWPRNVQLGTDNHLRTAKFQIMARSKLSAAVSSGFTIPKHFFG